MFKSLSNVCLTFTDGASSVHRMPALHLLSVMFNVAFYAIGRVADVAGDAFCALPVAVATGALAIARPINFTVLGRFLVMQLLFAKVLLLANSLHCNQYFGNGRSTILRVR